MSKFHGWLALIGLCCLAGCRIETHEGDDEDVFGDDETCENDKTSSEPKTNQPGCEKDTDCANGNYCDIELRHCVASASCSAEIDCDASMNCDSARSTCVPSGAPTCGEVTNESDCVARADCSPIYAGVDCSCGADCVCQGGEPGCVCESFEFFRCEPAPL